MDAKEKAEKFDMIQKCLWNMARGGNPLVSSMAAAIIQTCSIEGPDGEDPEEA